MESVQFVVDEADRKVAVTIDLTLHGEVWEDIHDALLVKERKDEPSESWEEVKQHLKEIGKLS